MLLSFFLLFPTASAIVDCIDGFVGRMQVRELNKKCCPHSFKVVFVTFWKRELAGEWQVQEQTKDVLTENEKSWRLSKVSRRTYRTVSSLSTRPECVLPPSASRSLFIVLSTTVYFFYFSRKLSFRRCLSAGNLLKVRLYRRWSTTLCDDEWRLYFQDSLRRVTWKCKSVLE